MIKVELRIKLNLSYFRRMPLDNVIAQFQELFPNLSDDDIGALLGIIKIVNYDKDDFFIREGDRKPLIGIVLQGIIRGYYITDAGQEMTPFFWEEGLITGSWETLYLNQPSALHFQAIVPTTLAVVDYYNFKKLAQQRPNIQSAYIQMVEIILTNTLLHQQSYINEKPERRYELFLENNPSLVERISQKHLASHLGITPISLSRMKSRRK